MFSNVWGNVTNNEDEAANSNLVLWVLPLDYSTTIFRVFTSAPVVMRRK